MTRRHNIILILSVLIVGALPDLAGGGHRRGHGAHRLQGAAHALEVSADRLHRSIDRARPLFVRARLRHVDDAAREFERESRRFRNFVEHEPYAGYRMTRRFERVADAYRDVHRALRHAPPTPWLRDELIQVRRRMARVQDLVYARSAYRDRHYGKRGRDRVSKRRHHRHDDDYVSIDLRLPTIHGRFEWND